jgi:hypothetical protein
VAAAHITVDLAEIKELIRRLRWFMANLLREVAEQEDARVAARLREVADTFEADEELK